MVCSKCGVELAAGALICRKCGMVVSSPGKQETVYGGPTDAPPQINAPQPPPSGFVQTPTVYSGAPSSFGAPSPSPYGYGQVPPRTDSKATTSLVLGILSITCLSFLTGIPAIIFGHVSYSNISKSGGRLTGRGLALAGLIMGYFSLVMPVLYVMVILPAMLKQRIAANEIYATDQVMAIHSAQLSYSTRYPQKGFAATLTALGPGAQSSCDAGAGTDAHACLLDSHYRIAACPNEMCMMNGYFLMVRADGSDPHAGYTVSAIPMLPGSTGERAFCASGDGIVHVEASALERNKRRGGQGLDGIAYTEQECSALPTS